MNKMIGDIKKMGIIPVIKIDDPNSAFPLAQALCESGLPLAEVTFRTPAAAEAIKIISGSFSQMLLGAGTVTTIEQVDLALACGASFIVSPGLNPKIVTYCIEKGIVIIPGVCTPSEMERAMDLGLNTVKFFPAEQSGGVEFLKAVSAPYPNLNFMPTGGIHAENIADYLSLPCVVACGGSWIVHQRLLEAGDFESIKSLTKEAVRLVGACRKAQIR